MPVPRALQEALRAKAVFCEASCRPTPSVPQVTAVSQRIFSGDGLGCQTRAIAAGRARPRRLESAHDSTVPHISPASSAAWFHHARRRGVRGSISLAELEPERRGFAGARGGESPCLGQGSGNPFLSNPDRSAGTWRARARGRGAGSACRADRFIWRSGRPLDGLAWIRGCGPSGRLRADLDRGPGKLPCRGGALGMAGNRVENRSSSSGGAGIARRRGLEAAGGHRTVDSRLLLRGFDRAFRSVRRAFWSKGRSDQCRPATPRSPPSRASHPSRYRGSQRKHRPASRVYLLRRRGFFFAPSRQGNYRKANGVRCVQFLITLADVGACAAPEHHRTAKSFLDAREIDFVSFCLASPDVAVSVE